MSENDRNMFQTQQKATLPSNAFLAESPASLYSPENPAEGTGTAIDAGWEQELQD